METGRGWGRWCGSWMDVDGGGVSFEDGVDMGMGIYINIRCVRGWGYMGNGGWTYLTNREWRKPQTKTNMNTY